MKNKPKKEKELEFTTRKVIDEETGKELTRVELKEGMTFEDFFKAVLEAQEIRKQKEIEYCEK